MTNKELVVEVLQRGLDNFNILTENNTVYVDVDIVDQGVCDTVMEIMNIDPQIGTTLDTLLDTYYPSNAIACDPNEFQNGVYRWLNDSVRQYT